MQVAYKSQLFLTFNFILMNQLRFTVLFTTFSPWENLPYTVPDT